jgi:pimeloyl-ACP methyl ester carboxylesterase
VLDLLAAAFVVAAPAPPLRLQPCRLPEIEEEVRCGRLAVPEDRSISGGRTVSLRIVVLPALLSSRPPLFILQGGPGQAATDLSSFYAETFAEARRSRDIVLVDQRGTGGSNPLACRGEGTAENPQGYLMGLFPLETIRRCRTALEGRADLRRYGTADAMADLDTVRAALGHERISLYGTSYGTRAALYYAQTRPHRVETMILKGVLASDEIAPIDFAANSQRALGIVIADCAADPPCAARFPNFAANVETVFARLGRGPVEAAIHRDGRPPQTVSLSREEVAVGLRSLLQSTGTQAALPSMFEAAAGGDFGPLADTMLRLREGAANLLYQGMMLSVLCAEDAPFIRRGAEQADGETFLRGAWTRSLVEACRVWPHGPQPRGLRTPRPLAVPTLLISGHADPATPPAGAERVVRSLTNSRHVVVRYGSHSFTGMRGCIDVLMARFLETAAPAGLDLSCADAVRRPPWAGLAPR